jgi:hypothetical protein
MLQYEQHTIEEHREKMQKIVDSDYPEYFEEFNEIFSDLSHTRIQTLWIQSPEPGAEWILDLSGVKDLKELKELKIESGISEFVEFIDVEQLAGVLDHLPLEKLDLHGFVESYNLDNFLSLHPRLELLSKLNLDFECFDVVDIEGFEEFFSGMASLTQLELLIGVRMGM